MTATLRTTLALFIALTWGLCAAGTAAAHTTLAGADPADGATVTAPPAGVTLTFTEDVNPAFATVVVTGGDGRDWAAGPAQVDGPRVRVGIGPDLPAGATYTVGYRVVSADGHPVSGSVTFSVAGASGAPNATTAAPPSKPASPDAESSESSAPLGTDSRTSILTAGAAGLLVAGAIVFWQSRRSRRDGGGDGSAERPQE